MFFTAVYFDNSATTKPCKSAVEAAQKAINEVWGNPSSLHGLGLEASKGVKLARKQVAALLGAGEQNLFFTPSGTVANNTAIFGAYEKLKRGGNRIITTEIEHPSVSEPIKKLREAGAEVIFIKPDKKGEINEDELLSAINENTILVSCMAVNNEVGSVLPLKNVKATLKRAGSCGVFHSDCVQAFSKIPLSPKSLGADIITLSGHKIHALKGVGGLYLGDKNLIKPHILGGGQESGILSGTENTPAIFSFGAAANDAMAVEENFKYVSGLKAQLLESIGDIPSVVVNSPENAIPHIINISVLGLPSQPIVNFLNQKGICISAGSACKMGHRSPVLTAMGLDPKIIDSAVRISLCRYNTAEEIEILALAIKELALKYGKSQKR